MRGHKAALGEQILESPFLPLIHPVFVPRRYQCLVFTFKQRRALGPLPGRGLNGFKAHGLGDLICRGFAVNRFVLNCVKRPGNITLPDKLHHLANNRITSQLFLHYLHIMVFNCRINYLLSLSIFLIFFILIFCFSCFLNKRLHFLCIHIYPTFIPNLPKLFIIRLISSFVRVGQPFSLLRSQAGQCAKINVPLAFPGKADQSVFSNAGFFGRPFRNRFSILLLFHSRAGRRDILILPARREPGPFVVHQKGTLIHLYAGLLLFIYLPLLYQPSPCN